MKITIHKSVPNDVYGIRDVQEATWLKTYPNSDEGITVKDIKDKFEDDKTRKKIEEMKKRYKDKNIGIWVAEVEGKIVGFCSVIKETKFNRIGAIYVLPNYQRRGIGKRLIKKAFAWLENGKNIFINVARYNKQAISFYEKFGFIKTGKTGTLDNAAKLPSGKFIPEIELVRSCSKK